ncbi:MAG: sigma-70 family RNA polymerase sigma factor [Clostridiales Family XIII bacterium]|jgi:RNA polymerase sigma-70 factor (ECF subfamily)|nr:sigma-70 family RNA polymerase sigma factor [Clostridiales Family XIII bacterium]
MKKNDVAVNTDTKLYSLVEKAIHGDVQAFEDLLCMQTEYILIQTKSLITHPDDVQDAVQDIAISMMTNINKLRDPMTFYVWQQNRIVYVCNKYIKSHKKRCKLHIPLDISQLSNQYKDKRRHANPHRILEEKDFRKKIACMIESLPIIQRTCVRLFYFDELYYKEIAALLGCTISTVSTNLWSGRRNIKKMLETNDIE